MDGPIISKNTEENQLDDWQSDPLGTGDWQPKEEEVNISDMEYSEDVDGDWQIKTEEVAVSDVDHTTGEQIKAEEVDISDVDTSDDTTEEPQLHQLKLNKKYMGKRSSRTTDTQYHTMLEFMKGHEQFCKGKMTGVEGSRMRTQLWDELTMLLNGDPLGPEKDAARWQKVWADWKCSARKKAAAVRSHRKTCGGGPPLSSQQLPSQLDKALTLFLSADAFDAFVCNESVPESGFAVASSSYEVAEEEIQEEDIPTPSCSTKRTLASPPLANAEISQASQAKRKKVSPAIPPLEPQLSATTLEAFANATTRSANAMTSIAVALLTMGEQQRKTADAIQSIANSIEAYLSRH